MTHVTQRGWRRKVVLAIDREVIGALELVVGIGGVPT